MSNEKPVTPSGTAASATPDKRRRRSSVGVWLLGLLSAIGIIGFLATFVLILMRVSDPETVLSRSFTRAPQQGTQGERGAPGPIGPPGAMGPAGPAGDPGIRIVRPDCPTGTCALECGEDEILLVAYCGAGRAPSVAQNERSALCRSSVRARAEVVAACAKAPRR
jgi:hypothetical protein